MKRTDRQSALHYFGPFDESAPWLGQSFSGTWRSISAPFPLVPQGRNFALEAESEGK